MATLLGTDGSTREVTPADGKRFTLAELQGYVGGYIELVKTRDGKAMYVNEDGIGLNLPANDLATARVHPRFYVHPPGIRGDAVIPAKGEA